MKIAVAQIKPIKGNIAGNIGLHKKLIDHGISHKADVIIFPELSITGYEPTLAKKLATDPYDSRFDEFQKISDTFAIIIGIGVPTKNDVGICISLVLFHPNKPRQVYSKKYLHSDEEPYFVSGQNSSVFIHDKPDMALAICYELSVPEHAENAYKSGAAFYITSVAKTAEGVEKASKRLSEIAQKHAMTVLMANCFGKCDGVICGGKSSVWNNTGKLIGQLNNDNEGLLILNTDTEKISKIVV